MDPPEHLDPTNIKYQPIIKILTKLRNIENSKMSDVKKLQHANPLLTKTLKMLINSSIGINFLQHRPLWNELHDRMAYYYPILNNIQLKKSKNKEYIPLFRTILHNDVVDYWYKFMNNSTKNTPSIHLHFDTHDDMNTPMNPQKILKDKIPTCNKINYPVTCMLLSKKIDNLFWLMPEWVYDTDIHLKQILHLNTNNELYYLRVKQQRDPFLFKEEVKNIKRNPNKSEFSHEFSFSRIHTEKLSGFNKIIKYIDNTPAKFILDIDLDYFTTNGKKVSVNQYKKTFDDLSSTYRASISEESGYPRDTLFLGEKDKHEELLIEETKQIKKRVGIFIEGLKLLKKHKITPAIINISDSTSVLLDGHLRDATFTNAYTPKYFVPYIHHLLIPQLLKLY